MSAVRHLLTGGVREAAPTEGKMQSLCLGKWQFLACFPKGILTEAVNADWKNALKAVDAYRNPCKGTVEK